MKTGTTFEESLWTFKTRNFVVEWIVSPCDYLDLSWCETGETRENIESGLWTAFDSEMRVSFRGVEIASDYLGESIYKNVSDFRDHIGINIRSRADGLDYGSYFSDMVRGAIREARETLAEMPKLRGSV